MLVPRGISNYKTVRFGKISIRLAPIIVTAAAMDEKIVIMNETDILFDLSRRFCLEIMEV
jgi:hypothetical protein